MLKKDQDAHESWAKILYVDNPHLYLPLLEKMKSDAVEDVNGLTKIFETFGVRKGSRVLDLFCGIGRHSINLAKRGYRLVGYDPSSLFLKTARNWARKEGIRNSAAKFYQGEPQAVAEVLTVNGECDFDAVIIMFNSLGFTGEKDDFSILTAVRKIVRSGCILVTETENRDWRLANFQNHMSYDFKKLQVHETWKFNLETSVSEGLTKYYSKRRSTKDLQFLLSLRIKLRLYSLHELRGLLASSGWKYLLSYGNVRNLTPTSYRSPNLITVSKKAS